MEEASPRTCWADSNDMTGPRRNIFQVYGVTYAQIIPAAFRAPRTVQRSVHSPCSSSKYTAFFIARAAFLVARCVCRALTSSCSMYSALQSMILRLQKVVCTVIIHQLKEDCLFTRCETECRLCSCGVEHVRQRSTRVK